MFKGQSFLDLEFKSSLVRALFNQEFDLKNFEGESLKIPGSFKDFSFIPGKKGFDLIKYMDKLKGSLSGYGVSQNNFNSIIPGVCEALKNAYEHGNKENNQKKIFWHQSFSNKNEIEFLIGDEGGVMDGNFLAYAINLSTKKGNYQIEKAPNFYEFRGDDFAPLGHSGIGTKVMNQCFDRISYYKNKKDGLTVYLGKKI